MEWDAARPHVGGEHPSTCNIEHAAGAKRGLKDGVFGKWRGLRRMAARNILRLGVTGALYGVYCGVGSTMETIQVVLDSKLLQAADRAAQNTKRNRSALIRDALREHLRRLEIRALEERDRDGYAKEPQMHAEALVWEAEAAWPGE